LIPNLNIFDNVDAPLLRTSQVVQASRDNRVVFRPSTAHRADGTPIPKNKLVGAKRQRDLSEADLHSAIKEIKLVQQQKKEVTC
jgi:hypothetical protein